MLIGPPCLQLSAPTDHDVHNARDLLAANDLGSCRSVGTKMNDVKDPWLMTRPGSRRPVLYLKAARVLVVTQIHQVDCSLLAWLLIPYFLLQFQHLSDSYSILLGYIPVTSLFATPTRATQHSQRCSSQIQHVLPDRRIIRNQKSQPHLIDHASRQRSKLQALLQGPFGRLHRLR